MIDRLQTIERYHAVLSKAITQGLEHEVERELCKTDLFYLLTVVLGRKDLNHDWLFARCREVQAEPNGYLDLWPRDHYKSTIITFAKTIQDILIDQENTIGLFSFTRPVAKKFLFQIKQESQANDKLKELFPEIFWGDPQKQAPIWSLDDGLVFRRKTNPKEATIEAWGLIDGQPTSKHFRVMVYDDMISKEHVTNPEMIEKVTTAWRTSRALRTENGVARYIGTRWHTNDTYKVILDQGSAIPRIHLVTKEGTADGEPVLRSREWVAEQRRDMGPYVFASQMLQDPTADRSQGFRESWLRYYEGGGDFTGLNKYLLVDPANEKKKQSDFTAMVVIGLGADENYYLLDAIRDRLNLRERADAVLSLHRRWRPRAVGYEKYGMQADIDYLKERMGQENYRFEITEVGGQLSKVDRIRRMIPVFAPADDDADSVGRFLLPPSLIKENSEGQRRDIIHDFIRDEYLPFPVGLHDDMFDAISRIWDIDATWPKPVAKPDRWARPKTRRRVGSAWAA